MNPVIQDTITGIMVDVDILIDRLAKLTINKFNSDVAATWDDVQKVMDVKSALKMILADLGQQEQD